VVFGAARSLPSTGGAAFSSTQLAVSIWALPIWARAVFMSQSSLCERSVAPRGARSSLFERPVALENSELAKTSQAAQVLSEKENKTHIYIYIIPTEHMQLRTRKANTFAGMRGWSEDKRLRQDARPQRAYKLPGAPLGRKNGRLQRDPWPRKTYMSCVQWVLGRKKSGCGRIQGH
jgi:hypothetical protein